MKSRGIVYDEFGQFLIFVVLVFFVLSGPFFVEVAEELTESKERDPDEYIHESGHDFLCSICEQKFKFKSLVIRHYQMSHSTIRNFHCKICSKSFKTSTARQQHVKLVHKLNLTTREIERM